MNLKKLAMLTMTIIMITGCTKKETPQETTTLQENSSQEVIASTETIETNTNQTGNTMIDREGTEFTMPAKMDHIISTAPSNTEVLVGLGMADQIAVVDTYSAGIEGLSDDVIIIDFRQPDIEAILEAECDILIASEHNKAGGEDPYHQIKEAGIPVVYLPTSVDLEGIYQDIEFLGELTNTSENADTMIADMKSKINEISDKVKESEPKTVYMEIGPAPNLFTLGAGTFLDEIITLAGGKNIFGDQEGWVSPSEETILTLNPEIIISNVDYVENPLDEIKARAGWETLQAVENDNVVLIDSNPSSRCSQNVVVALEQIAMAIHPEVFE